MFQNEKRTCGACSICRNQVVLDDSICKFVTSSLPLPSLLHKLPIIRLPNSCKTEQNFPIAVPVFPGFDVELETFNEVFPFHSILDRKY